MSNDITLNKQHLGVSHNMNISRYIVFMAGLLFAIPGFTHEPDKAAKSVVSGNIAPAAAEAVKVADTFSAAVKAGKLGEAGKLLDPDVLILESGYAEHSAAEYLAGHAKEDAAFLKDVNVQLINRRAKASGDMAWIGSESEMHVQKDGKSVTVLSTETMVLKRTDNVWKIVHIHWSSHSKKP